MATAGAERKRRSNRLSYRIVKINGKWLVVWMTPLYFQYEDGMHMIPYPIIIQDTYNVDSYNDVAPSIIIRPMRLREPPEACY